MWHAIMQECLNKLPDEKFVPPSVNYSGLKPVLRGVWKGGESKMVNGQEVLTINVHSILYWLDKNNPLGPAPLNPNLDPQFKLWEYPIQNWLKNKSFRLGGETLISQPDPEKTRILNQISFLSPINNYDYTKSNDIKITLSLPSNITITQVDYFVDENKIITTKQTPFESAFNPEESELKTGAHELKAIIYDQTGNTVTKTVSFNVSQ